ncbi:hypothetical protein H5410_013318 [Solanum commersonii]|uniref:Uncharacterized protein n=1 Tax=Solanum commersonii TaxID=4109 RepID=A0A9J6AUJ2_SOLCO|nr:hypothetical protein H5410_013318 [Solanum commersonii]
MKQGTAIKIMRSYTRITELPLSFFDHQPYLKKLHLDGMTNLASLPNSICMSKGLVKLSMFGCSKLESLPEEIGLLSLEILDLSYCNIIDGGLPEDIGSLSSLKVLNLCGNKFEHLPRIIAQLGALEYLDLSDCKKLTQVPEDIGCLYSLEELYLGGNNFEHLPQSISKLGAIRLLCLSYCKRLTQLPEDIGSLSSLKELHLRGNKFEHLPRSISQLGGLEYLDLSDCKRLTQLPEDIGCLSSLKELYLEGNNFEHLPRIIAQLGALEYLDLSDCKRLTQLPEDIGCLSSLKELYLEGNNFEHFPRSIAQLGALQTLDLSHCKKLTQLPEFPHKLHAIYADWRNDSFHDIFSSDSLSLRVFGSYLNDILSWFDYQGIGPSVSFNLPENWYVSDNFLGFVVCYYSVQIVCITAHLIPLCDDGMLSMTQEIALSNNPNKNDFDMCIQFLLMKFGVRLLYKDEAELQTGIKKSKYEEEATCSSSKKQRQI